MGENRNAKTKIKHAYIHIKKFKKIKAKLIGTPAKNFYTLQFQERIHAFKH